MLLAGETLSVSLRSPAVPHSVAGATSLPRGGESFPKGTPLAKGRSPVLAGQRPALADLITNKPPASAKASPLSGQTPPGRGEMSHQRQSGERLSPQATERVRPVKKPSPSASSPSPSFRSAKCHLSQRERQGRFCVPKRLKSKKAICPTGFQWSRQLFAFSTRQ